MYVHRWLVIIAQCKLSVRTVYFCIMNLGPKSKTCVCLNKKTLFQRLCDLC